mgnify:FL=1
MTTNLDQSLQETVEDTEENSHILSLSEDEYQKMQKVKLNLRSRDSFQKPLIQLQKHT